VEGAEPLQRSPASLFPLPAARTLSMTRLLLAALLLFALVAPASAKTTPLDVCTVGTAGLPPPTSCIIGNWSATSSAAPGPLTSGSTFQSLVGQFNLPANTSTGVCFTFRSSCSASDVAFVLGSTVFATWKLTLVDLCKGGNAETRVSINGGIPLVACLASVAYTISAFERSDVDTLFCNTTNCNIWGAPPSPPPPVASGAGASSVGLFGLLALALVV